MDTLHATQAITRTRIQALRTAMSLRQVDACLVPSADPHLSEYLPDRWGGRVWLSGFTGSVNIEGGYRGVANWIRNNYHGRLSRVPSHTDIQDWNKGERLNHLPVPLSLFITRLVV